LAIPGVTLELINSSTGTSEKTTSDEDGRYTFLFLIPGNYEVRVNKQGFVPFHSSGVSLQLETIDEKVQVSAQVPLVQTDNSSQGWVVDHSHGT